MSEENNIIKPKRQISGREFIDAIKHFFEQLIDLREGLDKDGTIIHVRNNKRMRGANSWMLMCSIMIASLGLDLNSPAVIIGAMLISPLMSPILGIGLAIGINDRQMLTIALRHFGISIVIAVLTSYIYFEFITPFGAATQEIEARTAPTLLDVLVALFGGLAGIISISRKDQSSAIPGVAIATALMPPLCVTGFGLATSNWQYALNSFYLFFINSTFIAVVTYVMIRYLRFPMRSYEMKKEERRTQLLLFGFGLLLVVPSLFILVSVVDDINAKNRISNFISDNFDDAIFQFDKDLRTDTFEINIIPFKAVTEKQRLEYQRKLREEYNVDQAVVRFPEDITGINQKRLVEDSNNEWIDRVNNERQMTERVKLKSDSLSAILDSLRSHGLLQQSIQNEAKLLFPNLQSLKLYIPNDSANSETPPLLYLKWKGRTPTASEAKLVKFVRYRAGLDTCVIAH